MAGRRHRSLDITSIQSLLSRKDDEEFIDDEGDSDSDDPRDDSDEDRDYVFGESYSESEESSDDEHEGPAASTLPPPRTVGAATSSPSTSWLQPSHAGPKRRMTDEGRTSSSQNMDDPVQPSSSCQGHTRADALSPPSPPQPTMRSRGRGRQRTCTRPTLRASRVNIRGRSQRMRTPDVNSHDSERWQWLDGDSYQPQTFNFDESGSGIRVADFSGNSTEKDYFNYFWNDEIIDTIVEESNRYFHFIQGGKVLNPHSRYHHGDYQEE